MLTERNDFILTYASVLILADLIPQWDICTFKPTKCKFLIWQEIKKLQQ